MRAKPWSSADPMAVAYRDANARYARHYTLPDGRDAIMHLPHSEVLGRMHADADAIAAETSRTADEVRAWCHNPGAKLA